MPFIPSYLLPPAEAVPPPPEGQVAVAPATTQTTQPAAVPEPQASPAQSYPVTDSQTYAPVAGGIIYDNPEQNAIMQQAAADAAATAPAQGVPYHGIPNYREPRGTQSPSMSLGGPDPNAPAISTGLVEVLHPASGAPPTSRIVPGSPDAAYQDWRAARLDDWFGAATRPWLESPVEQAPIPPGYSPYNNAGVVPGGVGNLRRRAPAELSAYRSAYRLEHPPPPARPLARWEQPSPLPPTAAPIAPIPLPVSGHDWRSMSPTIASPPDPSWRDFVDRLLRGIAARGPLANELGLPLRGGPPPRSG